MEDFKIEKGVEYPRKKPKYPFEKMEVGDSFFVELKEGAKINSLQAQLSSNAKSFCLRARNDWYFQTSKEGAGVRIWRKN